MKKWFWNGMGATSQFFNAWLYPVLNLFTSMNNFGNKDETISGVMGKNIRQNRCKLCKFICYFLNKLEKNHCKKSIEDDEG